MLRPLAADPAQSDLAVEGLLARFPEGWGLGLLPGVEPAFVPLLAQGLQYREVCRLSARKGV